MWPKQWFDPGTWGSRCGPPDAASALPHHLPPGTCEAESLSGRWASGGRLFPGCLIPFSSLPGPPFSSAVRHSHGWADCGREPAPLPATSRVQDFLSFGGNHRLCFTCPWSWLHGLLPSSFDLGGGDMKTQSCVLPFTYSSFLNPQTLTSPPFPPV